MTDRAYKLVCVPPSTRQLKRRAVIEAIAQLCSAPPNSMGTFTLQEHIDRVETAMNEWEEDLMHRARSRNHG